VTELLAPGDVISILRALADAEVVLIGGQALNVWCERFARSDAQLSAFGPFTSRDVDIQADRRAVEVVARRLSTKAVWPEDFDATNTGYFVVRLGDIQVVVNALVSPYGVSREDAFDTAIPVAFDAVKIRVLHPVLCMESRFANVAGLGRTRPRDLQQARASVVCVRSFLGEILDDGLRAKHSISSSVFSVSPDTTWVRKLFSVTTASTRSTALRQTRACRLSS